MGDSFLIGTIFIVIAWTPSVFNMEPRTSEQSYATASQGIWQHNCETTKVVKNSDMSITVTFHLIQSGPECLYQWNQRIVPMYTSRLSNETYGPCWSNYEDTCMKPLSIVQNIEDTSGYVPHLVGQLIIGITGCIIVFAYPFFGFLFCIGF